MKGDFYEGWRVTTPAYVVRSNLEVDVPTSMKPRIIEKNLDFKRMETVANGRRTYIWRKQNVDKFRGMAQKNPGAVLGGLAALAIGAGLLRRR